MWVWVWGWLWSGVFVWVFIWVWERECGVEDAGGMVRGGEEGVGGEGDGVGGGAAAAEEEESEEVQGEVGREGRDDCCGGHLVRELGVVG